MILDHTDPLVEYYSNYPDQEPEYAACIHDRYFQVALTFWLLQFHSKVPVFFTSAIGVGNFDKSSS